MDPKGLRRVFAALVFPLVCLAFPAAAPAGPISYHVTVNTSAIAGTAGFLDLQFNPGGATAQAATATVTHFASTGAALGSATPVGSVSGALPGTVVLNNTTIDNELLQAITYGTGFSFDVGLSGSALSNPLNGLFGTTFSVLLLDGGFNPQLTTALSGAVLTININPNGTTSVTNFPSGIGTGTPVATAQALAAAVPEPSLMALFLCGVVGLLVYRLPQERFC